MHCIDSPVRCLFVMYEAYSLNPRDCSPQPRAFPGAASLGQTLQDRVCEIEHGPEIEQ